MEGLKLAFLHLCYFKFLINIRSVSRVFLFLLMLRFKLVLNLLTL